MKTILVAGATGMTGRSVTAQLLAAGHAMRVVVRTPEKLPREVLDHPNLTVTRASILDLSDEDMSDQVRGCDAAVSCLGHVLSFKGMFGQPRKLCTDATRRLCHAIKGNSPAEPVKFILMSSVGVRNPDCDPKRSLVDRALLTLLRHTIPPHRDNETAAAYLHHTIGSSSRAVEWCCVRPDSLINAEVSAYEITDSPTTGITSGRPTTRANVAHLMTRLIDDPALWQEWKSRMPVVMNEGG